MIKNFIYFLKKYFDYKKLCSTLYGVLEESLIGIVSGIIVVLFTFELSSNKSALENVFSSIYLIILFFLSLFFLLLLKYHKKEGEIR